MATKIFQWYNGVGGSLSDGTNWFLENGSTPGGTAVAPGPSDDAVLYDYNGTTPGYYETVTGSISVLDLSSTGPSNGVPNSNFTLAGSITVQNSFAANGSMVVKGSLTTTDPASEVNLFGGLLDIDGGTLRTPGVLEGINTGGTFDAVDNATVTFLGAPNAVANGGLVGLSIKQSGLIDHAQVDSSLGLISVGTNNPVNNALLTAQDGAQVKALYTFLGSGYTNSGGTGKAGTLVITGGGTNWSDVGAVSTAVPDSGWTVVGAYSSTLPATTLGTAATLTVSNGATLTDSVGRIGEDMFGVGIATVASGASWTAANSLRIGQSGTGTLNVQAGGTVRSLGPHLLANSSISFGTNATGIGVGYVQGVGALLDTGGDRLTVGSLGYGVLTVSGGGRVNAGASYADTEAALSVGGSVGATGGVVVTDANSLVQIAGLAVVGGNNTGAGNNAGGSGALSVVNNGRFNATALALYAGGSVAVASGGIIDIGGTAGAAGALTVEAAGSVSANGGSIGGPVVDNGVISNGAGTLAIAGPLSGAGKVLVAGTVAVGSTTGGVTYQFRGAHAKLAFSSESGGSALVGFSQGDVLDFAGQSIGVSISGNTLSAGGASFGLYNPVAGTHYVVGSDGAGGTEVTAVSAADDYNGDGKSDLVLQNDNGTIVLETQSNIGGLTGYVVGNPGGAWHVVGTSDYNGDGQPDILVQNTNGALVEYVMTGTTVSAGYSLGTPGAAWHVRGSGDFNADGASDVLVQNDNGAMFVLYVNGASVTGGASIGNPGAGWTVEGVGDFNGDGQPDILVQNTDGTLVDYLMNGSTIASSADLGNPGVGWAVSGVGDYNGDGKSDILLHNDNGQDVIWETNGTIVTARVNFGNPGASYTGAVAGVDLNGDGSTDLVLQRNDSSLVGFTLDNTSTITGSGPLGVPGAGWHAIGDNPMMFIDGTGSTVNLAGTPGADQFDLTSYVAGLHQISGFDPAQDSVALSAATFPSYAALQAAEMPYQGGTYVQLTPGSALVIQGVTSGQLGQSNFALR